MNKIKDLELPKDPAFLQGAVMGSFNIGDEVQLEVYPELCCELCEQIEHNHINCPVCGEKYAETDQFCDLYDETQLACRKCLTVFEKTSSCWYYNCTAKIVSLGLNYPQRHPL